jgi:hypothetical protein
MIEEYFRKQQENLLDQKLNLEKEYTKILNQIVETEKFIELLEEKSDPNFESFTPRDVNVKNRSEIKSLQETKKKLSEEKNTIKIRIDECRLKIEEFQTFLHSVREEKTKIEEERKVRQEQVLSNLDILKYVSCEKEQLTDKFKEAIVNPMSELIQKVKQINQFMNLDRERARLELQQLSSNMEAIESNINSILDQSCTSEQFYNLTSYIDKYVTEYNQGHKENLQISYEIDSSGFKYESFIYQAIRNVLVAIIDDSVIKSTNMKVIVFPIGNENRFEIQIKIDDSEATEELKSILVHDNRINIYKNLLSVKINYDFDNRNEFVISFNY